MQKSDLDQYDLPTLPGVYRFFRGSDLLYIGKASSLYDRVRSYFSSDLEGARGGRIIQMVLLADRVEWETTDTALEALIREADLIKQFHPPYNVREKDDTSYWFVGITDEEYPRVLLVRGKELTQVETRQMFKQVFGPFPQAKELRSAIKIIRQIVPFRDTCAPGQEKPCFNAQIGLCPGVCTGKVTPDEYRHNIRTITSILSGKKREAMTELQKEMFRASEEERFLDAARFRDLLFGLEHIRDISLIQHDEKDEQYRIEAYDIAHLQGSSQVGVMTVIQKGKRAPEEYRTFIIRERTTADDIASLGEVITRRLDHTEWRTPDLIVVDGSSPQKHRAEEILRDLGLHIPVVAVVKNEKHKPERILGDSKIVRDHHREILLANHEAHRFAINFHKKKRAEAFLGEG